MNGLDVARTLAGWPRCQWIVEDYAHGGCTECGAWMEHVNPIPISDRRAVMVWVVCSRGHYSEAFPSELPSEMLPTELAALEAAS